MADTLSIKVERIKSGWAAYAIDIGIAAHGTTEEDARDRLKEAVRRFRELLARAKRPVAA